MFDTPLGWLLLPASAVLGWAWARRGGAIRGVDTASHGQAIAGLSSLARDDADAAIASLSAAVAAEPRAIELRLTLGGLFRKRGEIDRAITLHEALLNLPELPPDFAARLRLELAQDYLKGGVMDRAESLGLELLDTPQAAEALELLLDLYEQARDWPHAIEAAQRWQAVRGSSAAVRIAQYHCELADAARAGEQDDLASEHAQRALAVDHNCARAWLLLGTIAEHGGKVRQAFEHYRRLLELDPRWIALALDPTYRSAKALQAADAYGAFLDEAEALPAAPFAVVLAKARWLAECDAAPQAKAYLGQRLASQPQWPGIVQWLEWMGLGENAEGAALLAGLQKKLAMQARYTCTHCGFSTSVLFWQCPSCKQWASIRVVEVGL